MGQALAILILLATVLVGLWSLKKSEWALLLVMTMWAFEQVLQTYSPILMQRTWLANVLFAGIAGGAVLTRIFRGERVFAGYPNLAMLCIVGIFAYQYVAVLWAPQPEYVIPVMKTGFPYIILMMVFAPLLIKDIKQYEKLIFALLIIGTVMCLLIMFNPRASFGGERFTLSLGAEKGQRRGSPLAVASLGGMVALAAALIRFRGVGRVFIVARAVGFFSGLGLAILTGSRGQVLGVILVSILFYPMARRVKNVQQFFATALGAGVLVGALNFTWNFFISLENQARWTPEKLLDGVGRRFERVWDLFSAYLADPGAWLQGLGPGGYNSITGLGYVHNSIVEVLCELGLFGFVLFSLAIWCCFVEGRRVFHAYKEDPIRRSVVTILIALTFYQFFLSLKQGSIIGWPGPLMYILICSKILVTEQRQWEEEGFPVLDTETPDDDWDDPAELIDPESAADYGEYDEYDEFEEYDDGSLGYA